MANGDFIDILKDIRGTGDDLNTPGVVENAGNDVSQATGGIWQRLKDKEANITVLNGTVNTSSDNVDTKYADITEATAANGQLVGGYHGDVTTKSGVITTQYTDLTVTPTNGEAGKYGDIVAKHTEVVAKEALVAPHYNAIDTVGEATYKAIVEVVGETGYKADIEAVTDTAYKSKVEAVADATYKGKIETITEVVYKGKVETVADSNYKADVEVVADATYKAKIESVVADKDTIDAAESNAELAKEWATKNIDEVVVGQGYSAKQYAANSGNSASTANAKAEAAAASELKASQWAETAENTEVPGETGNYSSKHHSAKSEGHATIAENHKSAASESAGEASDSADLAQNYSLDSKGYRDELTGLTATVNTLIAGSNASTSYDSGTGVLTMGIPRGDKGERGDAFQIDTQGPIADKSNYNNQLKGYSYLSTDENPNKIYFKQSDVNEDNWSVGSPFGQGEQGEIGVGISSIARTAGNSSIGSTDTYTITYTDASTTTYDVVNGNEYTDVMARAAIDDEAMILTNKTMTSMTNQIGADTMHIKIKATEALVKGDVVKATGYNSGEDAIEVEKTSMQTDIALGVVQDDVTVGSFGLIINRGLVELLDTSAYGFGTILYSTGSGGFTDVMPTKDYQTVGYVVKNHAINGAIYIECTDTKPNVATFKTTIGTYTEFETAFDVAEAD